MLGPLALSKKNRGRRSWRSTNFKPLRMSIALFSHLIGQIWSTSFTKQQLQSGLRGTGLCSLNRQAIPDARLAVSAPYSQEMNPKSLHLFNHQRRLQNILLHLLKLHNLIFTWKAASHFSYSKTGLHNLQENVDVKYDSMEKPYTSDEVFERIATKEEETEKEETDKQKKWRKEKEKGERTSDRRNFWWRWWR